MMTEAKGKRSQKTERARVILVHCDTYDTETVYQAMRTGITQLGGMHALVDPKEKLLVKPNFLTSSLPETAVTTHPAVITAMFRILSEEGYLSVSYGDSPGHGSCEGTEKKLDLAAAAQQYGVCRADMETEVLTAFPEGKTAKEFYFAKGITQADAIISLCKMKTHALERVTGAVKNVYGFICGARKAAGHVKYPNASVFARMLADIHRSTDIRLHVMDGIVAMEGNGPGSGDPTPMNVLLFSTDPVALDTVFCALVDLDPLQVPTCVQGAAMGIGTMERDKIEVIEAKSSAETRVLSWEELSSSYGNPAFRVDRTGKNWNFLSRLSAVATKFARRPTIQKEKCVRCGICVAHCPVPGKAVDFRRGKDQPPVYDYRKCIRCYCCQEMCPQHAIVVKR